MPKPTPPADRFGRLTTAQIPANAMRIRRRRPSMLQRVIINLIPGKSAKTA